MLADGIGAAAKKGLRHVPAGSSGTRLHDLPVWRKGRSNSRRVDTYHLTPHSGNLGPLRAVRVRETLSWSLDELEGRRARGRRDDFLAGPHDCS